MGIKLAYFCSSRSWGGLEMNHLRNALWMSERGHEVLVIGVDSSPIHDHAVQFGLKFIGVTQNRRWYDFKAVRSVQELIQAEGVSHFIVRKPGDLSLAAGLKYKLKSNIHVSYFMEMQLGIRKKSIFHTIRYRYIDVWSCPLNWLKQQVEELTHFKNELVVIPSGIKLEDFERLPSMEVSRKTLDLAPDTFIVGMAGRFDPKKGQLILLEAMAKSNYDDFCVLFMGENTQHEGSDYERTLHQFITENKLEDRVIFRPYGEKITHFYRSVNWLVMASESETVGMVSIESLASETPVLGSNAGGTPEILKTSEGGVLFETMNADDLAMKIDAIIDSEFRFSPEKLKKLAQQYDHHAVCKKVEAALGIHSTH